MDDFKIGDYVWLIGKCNPYAAVSLYNINIICAEVVEVTDEHVRACIIHDSVTIAEYTQLKHCVFKSKDECLSAFIKHLAKG